MIPSPVKADVNANVTTDARIESSCKDCCPELECESKCCICFIGRKVVHQRKNGLHKVWKKVKSPPKVDADNLP